MNIYSRALRHINIEDVKKKHQQKLVEQKLQEQKEKQEEEFIASLMVEKKYDWKKELEKIEEVSVVKFVNYEYNWREKLLDDKKKYFEEGMTSSGTFFTTLDATGDVEYPVTEIDTVESGDDLYLYYDTRVYDTLVVDARVDPGISILLTTAPLASFVDPDDVLVDIQSSGTYSFSVPQSQNFFFNFLKGVGPDADPDGLAAIDAVRAKRKSPLNVFVSLDSPEATAFIRTDPMMANLSPQERLKKLKEMLEASDEYVLKLLGADFPGTGAVPPGEAGDTPGVEIAGGPGEYGSYSNYGTKPDGTKGFSKPGEMMKDDSGNWLEYVPGSGWQMVPSLKLAHYEPQGQVISEKRKLKSPQEILNKIPGYYDGKPAPLGFPVEPPPEMKNGMHPDLVDGKKVADRFNRLDPESAKAMPPTGNPHIDKKVKAARKKPK